MRRAYNAGSFSAKQGHTLLTMTNTTSAPLNHVNQPAARLVGTHGYRIEGDAALLQAQVEWLPGAQALSHWALQLWAMPHDAAGASNDSWARAVKVAELALQPGVAGLAQVEGWAMALPPAGPQMHTLWLVLASAGATPGLADAVHDQIAFARAEQFVQPSFQGAVAYRLVDDNHVELSAEGVANPRVAANLSGSLALELWALEKPYVGGGFAGHCLARTDLGTLAGQSYLQGVSATVPAAVLPPGRWPLCLMLREWSAAGHVCRDYVNFEIPHDVAAPAIAAAAAEVAETEAAAPAVESVAEVAAEPVSEPVVAPAEAAVAAPAAAPAAAVVAAPEVPAKAAPAAAPAADTVVRFSVNRATEAQLASIKGISKSIAKTIVAKRPYASLDELAAIKGLGPKTLARVRDQLKV
jgi:DNA uptake protein ComE-like DNA-binding protein